MTLTISHYIYLSKEERYKLHVGEKVDVIGFCVPVWFKKGSTSEPAKEIFCKYKLTNENLKKIIFENDGYSINLPQSEKEDDPKPSEKLLDISENGSEYIAFQQYHTMNFGEMDFEVIHFVEIKDTEALISTLD